MHARAAELLTILGMRPHPEGGHYAELFRSRHRVQVPERTVERAAITTIYFMLVAGEFSRWHRVVSDEIWHFHEGDAVELLLFDEQKGLRRLRLGAGSRETRRPVGRAAGEWPAAPAGACGVGGCPVVRGCGCAVFSRAVDGREVAAKIASAGPDLARF